MQDNNAENSHGVPTGSTPPSRIIRETGAHEPIAPPSSATPPSWPPPPGSHHGSTLIDLNREASETADYGHYAAEEHFEGEYEGDALPHPLRFAFGDMHGVVFLVWIPVLLAFFLPWMKWTGGATILRDFTVAHLISALIIAIPPWIVLTRHLRRGRMWDGVLDMFLWAIWECGVMITLCYLYPERAQIANWNAWAYWSEMSDWIRTGGGTEGNPMLWLPLHGLHLALLVIGALLLGLPALLLGVLLLNYMNFYVAEVMLRSSEPLVALMMAWHIWAVIRVAGYITLATALYQLEILPLHRRWSRGVARAAIGGIVIGVILVVLDAILKWQFADSTRQILQNLTGL